MRKKITTTKQVLTRENLKTLGYMLEEAVLNETQKFDALKSKNTPKVKTRSYYKENGNSEIEFLLYDEKSLLTKIFYHISFKKKIHHYFSLLNRINNLRNILNKKLLSIASSYWLTLQKC